MFFIFIRCSCPYNLRMKINFFLIHLEYVLDQDCLKLPWDSSQDEWSQNCMCASHSFGVTLADASHAPETNVLMSGATERLMTSPV